MKESFMGLGEQGGDWGDTLKQVEYMQKGSYEQKQRLCFAEGVVADRK